MKFRFGKDWIRVNIKDKPELITEIPGCFAAQKGFALATINLDHLEKLARVDSFKSAYLKQDYVVADGNPIVWLSKLAGRPVDLVPGSDLVLPLAGLAANSGIAVALIGSTDQTLDKAADHLNSNFPELKIALKHSPSQGFMAHSAEAEEILARLATSGAGLCLLALGAPKQEELAARGREICPHVGFASIGAGLDFLAGNQQRAPKIVRAIAMEWFWRMINNPLRLGPRYLKSFALLPAQGLAAIRLRVSAKD